VVGGWRRLHNEDMYPTTCAYPEPDASNYCVNDISIRSRTKESLIKQKQVQQVNSTTG